MFASSACEDGRMRKVLFLDIDGVLNSAEDFMFNEISSAAGRQPVALAADHWVFDYTLNPNKIALLWQICKIIPDLEIWVHSSWRRLVPWDALMSSLKLRMPWWDYAPFKGYVINRGLSSGHADDVATFLHDNPDVERYCIVDDHADKRFPPSFTRLDQSKIVLTAGTMGLTIPNCYKIVTILADEETFDRWWPLVMI